MTPKQHKFANVYLRTGNASEAYRAAYNTGNMKPATINSRAFELCKHSEIAAMVEQGKDRLNKRTAMKREEACEILAQIARGQLTPEEWEVKADRVRAIERLAKLLGWDSPEKRELSGPGGNPLAITAQSDLTRYTDAELVQMIEQRKAMLLGEAKT